MFSFRNTNNYPKIVFLLTHLIWSTTHLKGTISLFGEEIFPLLTSIEKLDEKEHGGNAPFQFVPI
ncbi:MAG: hypothetical protein AB2693_29215, partial [Candidatus Thiodiazotropha sp.]